MLILMIHQKIIHQKIIHQKIIHQKKEVIQIPLKKKDYVVNHLKMGDLLMNLNNCDPADIRLRFTVNARLLIRLFSICNKVIMFYFAEGQSVIT